MSSTPEGLVKTKAKRLLQKHGVMFFLPVSNGMGKHGISDFICCEPVLVTQDMVGKVIGRFTALEAKAPGKIKAYTPHQFNFLEEVAAHGGRAVLFDNAGLLEGELWPTM